MTTLRTESIRIAVALRVARVALGLNQIELAPLLGISKVSLARIETLDTPIKADVYMRAIKIFKEFGVNLDVMSSESLHIEIEPKALDSALGRLDDSSKRRADRKHENTGVDTT